MKEWIKTRLVVGCLLVVFIAATAITLTGIGKTAELGGIGTLWSDMLEHDDSLVDALRYLPPIAGLLLAIAQMVPETQQKRLKLTLHLPYPEGHMVLHMLGYGLGILVVLDLLQTAALGICLRQWLPAVMAGRSLVTMLPWQLCSLTVYLWVAAVCLEPAWRRRIIYLLITGGLTYAAYLTTSLEAYRYFIPVMAVWAVCSVSVVFTSVARFKEGNS